MAATITQEQVIARIEQAGWKFKDQTQRVLLFKRKGEIHRVVVRKRDLFPLEEVRNILTQAKLSRAEIDDFLKHAVKS